MAAVDRLLTDDNARSHPAEWAQAAVEAFVLIMITRDWAEAATVARKAEQLATEVGLPYEAAQARSFHTMDLTRVDLEAPRPRPRPRRSLHVRVRHLQHD